MISYTQGKVRDDFITHDHSILTARINGQNESKCSEDAEQFLERPMSYCSRFDSCSAPKCPLDIFIESRIEVEGDPKCGVAKATRHKYCKTMPDRLKKHLPYEG